MDKQQQKPEVSKKSKTIFIATITGLIGYIGIKEGYKRTRKALFGDPENPWRKALFYTAVAGTIIAHKYGDEIKESYHNFMDRTETIIEKRTDKRVEKLRNKLEEQYNITKSLEEANELMREGKQQLRTENSNLRNENQNLEQKISVYQTRIREHEIREEERNHLVNYTQRNITKEPRNTPTKQNRTEPKKEESKGILRNITNGITNIFTRDNEQETKTDKWYIVRPGETLSGIAQNFYGDINLFNELARHNNIRNPSDIAVGTPIRMLPGRALKTNDNIQTGTIPSYATVRRGESLADVVVREGLARPNNSRAKAQEILNYNINELGYRPINMRESRIRESVIYLK